MLTIHINDNWLVFCMFSENKLIELNKINFLEKKSPTFLLKSIKKYFKNSSEKLSDLEIVKLVYYNTNSTLVPTDLFDEKNSLNFLKFNAKIQVDDFTANDSLIDNEIKNIYVPYVNINNYIFEKFNSFEYHHYSTILIEELKKRLNSNFSNAVFLNIGDKNIDITHFNKGKIIFYNSFEFSNNEDVLYYLLYCLNELNLDTKKILVSCTGQITIESALYELLYTYIQNIEILDFELSDNDQYNKILNSNILLNLYK